MPSKDFDQLSAEIDAAVHPNGPLGKTTAAGLGAVLKSLAAELTAWQLAAATAAEALSGSHLAAWGDSLTSGLNEVPYTVELANLTGFTIYNGGVGGETSVQIKDRMLADPAKHAWPTLIWAGRNDSDNPQQVVASIGAMVAALGHSQYLVLATLNAADEGRGTYGYEKTIALNNQLAAAYGAHYLDVRAYLVAHADTGNDTIPPALHKPGDLLHLNAAGYALVAACIYERLGQLLSPGMAKLLSVRAALSLLDTPTLRGKVTQIGRVNDDNLLELRAANGQVIAFAGAGNVLYTTGDFYVNGGDGLVLQAAGTTALEIRSAAIYPKLQIVSPNFVGTPLAPTAGPGTDTAQVATTAFVGAAIKALGEQGGGGVAHRGGNALTFERDAEYDPIAAGTFTVDVGTKRVGAVVVAYLTPAAAAPALPAPAFQSKDAYVAGKNLMYMFKVGANGSIQYTITVLD